MKRLILMRHAKSDWAGDLPDIERGLNARGTRSAEAIGDWMRSENVLPDSVLCSAATRTQETLAGLKLSEDTAVTVTRELYLADPEEMLAILRTANADTVLMLGHNPGSAMLASDLVAAPPAHADFHRFPTCATLVADFTINDWSQLRIGTGTVRHFVVPREIMK
ncbi:histidine phosphatase family protein [Sulfitobacter sp. HNIBRBA3233]|uniref:SixA phosphatase family protein n=1 Tax=Sulfitobacter marinivivus TaxID=3158558 RepID=UPI0032DEC008